MIEPRLGSAFALLLRRDLVLAYRQRSELANPLLFFVIVVTLFPLGVGPSPQILAEIAPGVVWVAALLAALLSLDGIFRSDFEDGTLEQLVVSPHPVAVLVLAKVIAHWLVTGLPLTLISPVLAVLMNLSGEAIPTLVVTLALGTPVLSLIGAIGVALTVGLRRGGVLLSLLVLPLYIPVLIFAASAVGSAASGLGADAQIAFLGALLSLALVLAPPAAAAALRVSLG
jgi:heme exporter protein B